MSFAVVSYTYSAGNVLLDTSLPLEGTTAHTHSITGAYVRSIDVFGLSGRFTAAVPLATAEWDAERGGSDTSTVRTGVGDPFLSFGVGLLGAPALRAKDMAGYRPGTLIGASVGVSIPVGQYDSEKFFNLGTNRWRFVPGVGVSRYTGRWTFELQLRAWLSTTNRDFYNGNTVEQDPMFGFQLHAEYTFRRGLWAGVSFGQTFGGETTLNGDKKDDPQTNNRFGVTLAIPIGSAWALKAGYYAGISVRAGGDFDTVAVGIQYRWGGM